MNTLHNHIYLLKDSKQVELSKLNPDKAYIQVTFAEPYFDNYGEYTNTKIKYYSCLISLLPYSKIIDAILLSWTMS